MVMALVLALLTAACRQEQQYCSLVLYPSGVGFDMSQIRDVVNKASRAQACVHGECVERSLPLDDRPFPRGLSAGRGLTATGPFVASLILRDKSNRIIYSASGMVSLRSSEPNGAGCGTTWRGELRALPDQHLYDVG